MFRNILGFAGVLFGLTIQTTQAGGFEGKTMRDPFSNRSVERGLVLGKGWFQIGTGSNYKLSTGYWDSDGVQQDFANTSWLYSTQHVSLTYGITRNVELSWKVKSHYVGLTNTELGTDFYDYGLGDPEMMVKYQLYKTSTDSVIVYGNYKAPLANEMPGNYVGGPNTFSAYVFTTGTPDLDIGLAAKKQFGPMAVTVDMAHVRRFSSLANYAIETDLNQFQTRVKPGDINRLNVTGEMQFGFLNLQAGGSFQQRGFFQIGPTSAGWFPNKNLENIADSNGWSLDARLGATFNILNELDLKMGTLVPLRGEDLMFFPLEDVHPTYGTVYNGELLYRF